MYVCVYPIIILIYVQFGPVGLKKAKIVKISFNSKPCKWNYPVAVQLNNLWRGCLFTCCQSCVKYHWDGEQTKHWCLSFVSLLIRGEGKQTVFCLLKFWEEWDFYLYIFFDSNNPRPWNCKAWEMQRIKEELVKKQEMRSGERTRWACFPGEVLRLYWSLQLILYWSLQRKYVPCGGDIQALIHMKELLIRWAQVK